MFKKVFLLFFAALSFSFVYSQPHFKKIIDYRPSTGDVVFSPDMQYLVTSAWRIYVYKFNSGEPELYKILQDNRQVVTSAIFSHDGKWFLMADMDSLIYFYRADQGFKLVKKEAFKSKGITSLALSHDDRFLAVGFRNGAVDIYRFNDGNLRIYKRLTGHFDIVSDMIFSANDKFFATSSYDYTVNVYSVENGDFVLLKTLQDHEGNVEDISFSPDSKWLATGGDDKQILIYRILGKNVQLYKSFDFPDLVNSVNFSPDGLYLVAGGQSKQINLYQISHSGIVFKKSVDFNDYVIDMSFSPKNNWLVVTGGKDQAVIFKYKADDFSISKVIKDYKDLISSVRFSPDGMWLAASRQGFVYNLVNIYDFSKGSLKLAQTMADHTDFIQSIDFSRDGKFFASTGLDGKLNIYQFLNGKYVLNKTFTGPEWGFKQIKFGHKWLLAATMDDTIQVYSISQDLKLLKQLKSQLPYLNSLDISPDDQFMITGNQDQIALYMFRGSTAKFTTKLSEDAGFIDAIAFSPRQNILAFGGSLGQVYIVKYGVEKLELLQTIGGFEDGITDLRFSKDGKLLAVASKDFTVKVFELKSDGKFRRIANLTDHVAEVYGVDFTPDMQYLVTGGNDGLILYRIVFK